MISVGTFYARLNRIKKTEINKKYMIEHVIMIPVLKIFKFSRKMRICFYKLDF